MDITQLRYFISAAHSQNFSEAARRHFITQPALSHQINALENELGVRLFVRSAKQVRLTSAGELFLPAAVDMVERMADSVTQLRRHCAGQMGRLRIGMVNSSADVVTRVLAAFCPRYPGIEVDLSVTVGTDQLSAISEGRFDFHFTTLPMVAQDPRVDFLVTREDRFCVAMPREHPLAREPLDFARLADEPFYFETEGHSPTLSLQLDALCAARSFTPRVAGYCSRLEATLLPVAAGVGMAIVPASFLRSFAGPEVVGLPIPGEDSRLISVAAWRKDGRNLAAEKFREVLGELFPGQPGAGGEP